MVIYRLSRSCAALALLLATACSSTAELAPVQRLDERTGVTVASLPAPLEFVQSATAAPGQHASFAYLGPIAWDTMGKLSYRLWVHVAPGNDRQVANLTGNAELQLTLDDGPLILSLGEAPLLARQPYRPVASWGQTAYFSVDLAELERLARSARIGLSLRGADGRPVNFEPQAASSKILTAFLQAQGVTGD
jgi:ABC-type amino acid transport substrate-binding protein